MNLRHVFAIVIMSYMVFINPLSAASSNPLATLGLASVLPVDSTSVSNSNTNLNVLLNILKDPVQVDSLITAIENGTLNPTLEQSHHKAKEGRLSSFSFISYFFVGAYEDIQLYKTGIPWDNYRYTFLQDLKHIGNNLPYIYKSLGLILLFTALLYCLNLCLHLILKNNLYIKNYLNTNKNNLHSFSHKINFYTHLFIRVMFPICLALIIVLFNNAILTSQIYKTLVLENIIMFSILLCFHYFIQFLLKHSPFSDFFVSLRYRISSFFILIYIFFIADIVLLSNNLFAQYEAFLKLVLLVFIFLFTTLTLSLVKSLKQLKAKVSVKFNSNNQKDNKLHVKNFTKALHILQIMGILIGYVGLFLLMFHLDYIVIKTIIYSVFGFVIAILFVYGIYNIIYHYIAVYIFGMFSKISKILSKHYLNVPTLLNYLDVSKALKITLFFSYFLSFYLYAYIFDVAFDRNVVRYIHEVIFSGFLGIIINVIFLCLILLICHIIFITLLNKKIAKLHRHNDITGVNKILSILSLCYKPYQILMFLVGLIVLLSILGISFTAVIASTGIITVLVAFGLKDILQNFVNAILYVAEDSFSINDSVNISGKIGVVEGITLLYIKVRDAEGALHMIPFSALDIVTNNNKEYGFAVIDTVVSLDEDYSKLVSVLQKVSTKVFLDEEALPIIAKDAQLDVIGVTNLNIYSMSVRCRIKSLPGKQSKLKLIFLKYLQDELKISKIKLPQNLNTLIS